MPINEYNPPETLARTSHSITILFGGKAIGMINSWAPNQTRQITPIYEIDVRTSGIPTENLPGNVQGLTLTVQRYDLWTERLEKAFGRVDLFMLSNQKAPFVVQERWTSPSGAIECWQYENCWFSSLGRAFRSDDTRLVNVNASITYTHKTLVQGL